MTTNMQQGTLLDVLKKKMRQTKEEMEKYKDECEEYQKRLQAEVIRREEVSLTFRPKRKPTDQTIDDPPKMEEVIIFLVFVVIPLEIALTKFFFSSVEKPESYSFN